MTALERLRATPLNQLEQIGLIHAARSDPTVHPTEYLPAEAHGPHWNDVFRDWSNWANRILT